MGLADGPALTKGHPFNCQSNPTTFTAGKIARSLARLCRRPGR